LLEINLNPLQLGPSMEGNLEQATQKKDEALMEACREFESIFVYYMLKAMRDTVPEGELIPRSMGEDIFESMLDEEIAKDVAKTDDFGLSKMLYEQLSRVNVHPEE